VDFWRRKKEAVLEPEKAETAGESSRPRSRSTALSARPIPEDALILIPLRGAVLFPGVTTPITVGRSSSIAAAAAAVREDLKVGFVLQRDAKKDDIGPDDLYRVGTAGTVSRYAGTAGGTQHLMVQGDRRFRVLEFLEGWPFLVASVAWIPEATDSGQDSEARFLQLKEQSAEAIRLLPNAPDELGEVVQAMRTPGPLADLVASMLDISNEQKQEILETAVLSKRLDLVLDHLARRVEVMRLSK